MKYKLTTSLLRALSWLPYRLVAQTGEALGSCLYRVRSKRRHILETNLRLCFPDKSDAERHALARDTFRHVIRSYLERGYQWYGSANKISKLVSIESAIDLADRYEQPTIFLGFHFVGIEAGCVSYSTLHPVASVYTPMSSIMTNQIALQQRARFGVEMISRNDSAREILKVLKTGKPVMLASDMDFGLRNSVFVPFFGVAACTLTSASRLASASGARVVPFITEVLPDYRGYHLRIFAPLEDYPSKNPSADALRMNQFLEAQVERMPEQYYWVHRRFKRRPEGENKVY